VQKLIYILFASTVIMGAIAGSFFYLYENSHYTGGFSGIGGNPTQQSPLLQNATMSFYTVTRTQTVVIESSYSPPGAISTSQNFVNKTLSGNQSLSTQTTLCQYIQGQLNCTGTSHTEYVAYLQNINGSNCAYDEIIPFRINGTIFANWERVSNTANNKTVTQNYFNLNLSNIRETFQNGTLFWHYTGKIPANFTTFSVLTNQSVIINTTPILNFNNCLPASLLVNPVPT
jgi:hypothetical protein